jgi:hypothetical protein
LFLSKIERNHIFQAAAAVGNTLSDCGGVLCAEYVEALAAKLKIQRAGLSRRQKNFFSTRCASLLGASLGKF